MTLKWQDLAKYAGGGVVSLGIVLMFVLNMSGMSYSDSGDVACTDCYSEIQVNSSIWEICVEHAGESKDVIFAKSMSSRRRWINLDKITEVVITEPNLKVDIMVPTTKQYAEVDHEEYGYLRNVKDGDCIIKRRTQANDRASRIILHGQKFAFDTIKWSFIAKDPLMENIDIDPLWLPITKKLDGLYECINRTTITRQTIWELVNWTYLKPVYGTCQHATNPLSCLNTSGPNTDCENRESVFNFTCVKTYTNVTDEINKSVVQELNDTGFVDCKLIGYRVKNREIDLRNKDYSCTPSQNNTVLICDSKIDGNGDGICQSGESCSLIDVRTLKIEYNYDNVRQKKIVNQPEGSVTTSDFQKVIKRQ